VIHDCRVAGGEQRRCRTVGHRKGTAVDISGRREEIDQRELVHARVQPKAPLVRYCDESLLRRDAFRFAPKRRHLDRVDAITPRIPLNDARLELAFGELLNVQIRAGALTEHGELRLDLRPDIIRQRPMQIRPQDAVVVILIPELRRCLDEGHPDILPPRPVSRAES
jgi:hypothetical protein